MLSDASHNPKVHLNLAGDNPEDPRVLRVTVKQSKTDSLRKPLPRQDVIRPAGMLNYLVVREAREGPLFIFKDGRLRTRQRLVRHVREVLESVGEDQSQFPYRGSNGGSGAWSVIKTLGRWRSLADLEYISIPKDQLASYSRILGS